MLLVLDMTNGTYVKSQISALIDKIIQKQKEADEIRIGIDFKDSNYKQQRYNQLVEDITNCRKKINTIISYNKRKDMEKAVK